MDDFVVLLIILWEILGDILLFFCLYFVRFFHVLFFYTHLRTWRKDWRRIIPAPFLLFIRLVCMKRDMENLFVEENTFDLWNQEKKKLNRSNKVLYPQPGEIWYIKIWVNIWKEIYWKEKFFRPVLVINKIGNMYFCIPMTTKWKQSEYYFKILSFSHKKDSYLVVNQWRVFDTQRFFIKIGRVFFKEFEQIKKLLSCKYFPEVL